jgi:hypothetical protein
MVTDFAVAQGMLLDREMKIVAIEKRQQQEFASRGEITVAAKRPGFASKVMDFARGLRPERAGQGIPVGLAGDAAA